MDIFVNDRPRMAVIDGDVKKPLKLSSVQIEGQNASRAGAGQQVGDQLGRDRHTADVFAILSSVAVIRQHCGEATGDGFNASSITSNSIQFSFTGGQSR